MQNHPRSTRIAFDGVRNFLLTIGCKSQQRFTALLALLVLVTLTNACNSNSPWIAVDSPLTSVAPCATDYGSGRVALFVTGKDHIVYSNLMEPDGRLNAAKWTPVSGLNRDQNWFDGPVACSQLNGELFVFGRTTAFAPFPSGTIMMAQQKPGTPFTNWSPLPERVTTDQDLSATATGFGVFLFRVTPDKKVLQNQLLNGTWSGWSPASGDTSSNIGVGTTRWGDRALAVFLARNPDKKVYFSFRKPDGSSASNFFEVPQGTLSNPLTINVPVAASSVKNNDLEIFALQPGIAESGTIVRNTTTEGSAPPPGGSPVPGAVGWSGWQPLPGDLQTSNAPAAALHFVFVVSNNRLFVQLL